MLANFVIMTHIAYDINSRAIMVTRLLRWKKKVFPVVPSV